MAALAKAVLIDTGSGEHVPVMYNPEEYRLEQGNEIAEIPIPGRATPPVQYVRGRSRTLSMELFFDTYERGGTDRDVRGPVRRILDLLAQRPSTHAPPVLLFVMGSMSFRCVLVQADQRYTMFAEDGTPVRAALSVRLQEYATAEVTVEQGLFVGPPAVHTLAGGDTLAGLAATYLGDPARWRELATENGIVDPIALPSGTTLRIPGVTR
ncbi:peptidoglycan-binding protein [Pseudonocardia endophytica]|uniref:LysM domain-containing protein n=1 Tax=Pseudonocardia endophytica TaxID=401976 RepID=A0A4R1HNU2_PSEEN|nr:peptidoglycan-binding protein [Pseudonocardia endophytica]TCK22871.1 hypothetical protein EV378_6882 [Pseudonocardia endophytica]